jgi:hypothetical protein
MLVKYGQQLQKLQHGDLVGRREGVDGIKATHYGLGGASVRTPVGEEIFFPPYRRWDAYNHNSGKRGSFKGVKRPWCGVWPPSPI